MAKITALSLGFECFPKALNRKDHPGESVWITVWQAVRACFLFIKVTQSLALFGVVFDVRGWCGNFCFM